MATKYSSAPTTAHFFSYSQASKNAVAKKKHRAAWDRSADSSGGWAASAGLEDPSADSSDGWAASAGLEDPSADSSGGWAARARLEDRSADSSGGWAASARLEGT